jgi:hypothetical protein
MVLAISTGFPWCGLLFTNNVVDSRGSAKNPHHGKQVEICFLQQQLKMKQLKISP